MTRSTDLQRSDASDGRPVPGTSICRQEPLVARQERIGQGGNPVKTVPHTISGVASIIRSVPRRVQYGEVDLPDLVRLHDLHDVVEQALGDTVRALYDERDETGRRYHSWTDIGRALGITRQAARQRFERGGR